MNSAPETLCIICGGRSPSSSAVPMKLALKPIISTTGVTGSLSARASGNATGAIIRMTTTLSTNIEITPDEHRQDHHQQPGSTARQAQCLHRQPARHAGLAEVAGDDPDAHQDRHHVPVDQLERIDLGHHPEPNHHGDAEQRGDGAVDDVGDDHDDGDRKHDQGKPGECSHRRHSVGTQPDIAETWSRAHFTSTTGSRVWCITLSVVEPASRSASALRPCVPITM